MTDRPYNRLLGVVRLAATYTVVALLAVFARPTLAGWFVGCSIISLGEGLRLWASGYLHKNVVLITAGPYAYTRNPLYLGRLLILTGLCVVADLPYGLNWLALGLGYAVFFGYYLGRKERVEPARLRALHGERFDRYRDAVPALFPTLRRYVGEPAAWSAERMRANREHWMVIGLALVLGWLLWRT